MLLFFANALLAQDKIFTIDGDTISGKIIEINTEAVIYKRQVDSNQIYKTSVMLIEYGNATFEFYNKSLVDTVVYNTTYKKNNLVKHNQDFIGINTAALTNSDLSIFYEHLFAKARIGVGGMAAYNFNKNNTILNFWTYLFTSAKKKNDVGAFVNVYLFPYYKKTNYYLGFFYKFQSSEIKAASIDSSNTSNVVVTYKEYNVVQNAFMGTLGFVKQLNANFQLNCNLSFGTFKIQGSYKEAMLNTYRDINTTNATLKTLPKIYLGINLMYKL